MIDLGFTPLCENLRRHAAMDAPETYYPLKVLVCDRCWLAQLSVSVSPDDVFREYAYFSSVSSSWVAHARDYAESMTRKLLLDASSLVVEVASNDGYLLEHFDTLGVPSLGIEPAANVAKVAQAKGIDCVNEFFGVDLAKQLAASGTSADLMVANNVLAHVPDINDFVGGFQHLLAPAGVLTVEFPHLMRLMDQLQFDTIYHEHFSYLSLAVVSEVFSKHGLRIFDVEELATHGGSLRVYACLQSSTMPWDADASVQRVLQAERDFGLQEWETYAAFAQRVQETKRSIVKFLIDMAEQGKTVVGYGAPGKATTLLHACGIDSDLLKFTVDKNAYKQGHFMPGTSIEIRQPDAIMAEQPDFVLILPWNLSGEIMTQMADIRQWGGQFVVPIPKLTIL